MPAPTVPLNTIPIVDAAARARAYANVAKKREHRLARIMLIASGKKITNADVVRHLLVSDATASRYLHALVSRGLLVAEGKGRGRHYRAV